MIQCSREYDLRNTRIMKANSYRPDLHVVKVNNVSSVVCLSYFGLNTEFKCENVLEPTRKTQKSKVEDSKEPKGREIQNDRLRNVSENISISIKQGTPLHQDEETKISRKTLNTGENQFLQASGNLDMKINIKSNITG